jgi:DNA polymerase I-like protein with 3'-5' exonuclease and polymerase domains
MFRNVKVPEHKTIIETKNPELFYKFTLNEYYVPPIEYIRKNLKELDILFESVNAFIHNDKPQIYDWNNLKTAHYKTESDAVALIDYLKATQKFIACDIESKNTRFHGNRVLVMSFAWKENTAASITIFTDTVLKKLQQLFNKKDITFIWQGGKFDRGRLKFLFDLDVRVDEDTMLQHYTGINEIVGTHDLETLAQLYLQAPDWKSELDKIKKRRCKELGIKVADFDYSMFDLDDELVPYANKDVIATYRLHFLFKKIVRPDSEFIYRKLIRASNIFADIERRGVYADLAYIDKVDEELTEEINQLLSEINKIAAEKWDAEKYVKETGAKSCPDEFNVNSSKQLKWLLNEFGIRAKSTDAKTLKKCKQIPLVKAVREYRKVKKLHSTYVDSLRQQVEADGRIHTSLNLHGTATGRLSSSDPNLQNIPRDKRIKNIFVATPGYVLVQADYKQAELCTLGVLADDPWLKQVYIDGKDLHDEVSIQMFGPNFTKEQRVRAKGVNFGIAYGRTNITLAEEFKISKREAQKLIDDWFIPMPKVKKFFDDWRSRPLKGKECKTVFGRVRHFVVTKKNAWRVQNEAMNFPIQSTASDLTLFSLMDIHDELEATGLGRLVLTVHDSIIAECKPENVDKVAEIMTKHMKRIPKEYLKTDVPFRADIEIGTRWGEVA